MTNPTGSLDVGAIGRIRLTNLGIALRTTSGESLDLEAEVVGKQIAGYGIYFLGGNVEGLEQLLDRAFARCAIKSVG